MARAIYENAEIYIMDDPLSALDTNVRKKVFDKAIDGKLKGKTRIIATHIVDFL